MVSMGRKMTSQSACSWEKTHSFLKTAMGVRLLWGVALCFLAVGLVDTGVTQTPRFLVKRMGEKAVLECLQDMDYERMFWYRQDPGLGLRLIYFSYDADNNDKGDIPEGYSVSRKKRERFSLILESASFTQTALYLCACSKATVLHSHSLPAQKRK
ncbi:Hypothetical predicted protein [Marmota monax]|uniref:Immunoglobulin V-set domain-containing protein n=3 Tax=Marmota TaxID=9992 RepID=A0A5E4AQT4_MARMO|nr:Hypothetical predicted protein [Marmota monax]